MKDGIVLHPEHGLNPSIELCIVCGEEMGGADRGVLLCSITDSGFTSIAGVISAVKDRLPNEDHKKMVFEILNDTKKEYGRYNNCGTKVL